MMRHLELGHLLLPGSLYAVRNYLAALVKAGRPVQELTDLVREGININPYDPDNYHSLIDTFVELKKYRHALEIAKGLQQLFEPEINPRTRMCLSGTPRCATCSRRANMTRSTRSDPCCVNCGKRRWREGRIGLMITGTGSAISCIKAKTQPSLVPQITIVRPPRPDYLQIVHSLPIFHSKSPGAARWRPSPDGRCRSNEMVERTCG